jgi:hypothetical protein
VVVEAAVPTNHQLTIGGVEKVLDSVADRKLEGFFGGQRGCQTRAARGLSRRLSPSAAAPTHDLWLGWQVEPRVSRLCEHFAGKPDAVAKRGSGGKSHQSHPQPRELISAECVIAQVNSPPH